MKKIIVLVLCAVMALSLFAGCAAESAGFNQQLIDVNYRYNYAFISLPNGASVEGSVSKWMDYDDSDMIQVIFTDGNIYYSHGSNIILIYDPTLEG